jgi:hypothetical protein
MKANPQPAKHRSISTDDFITPEFLRQAKRELEKNGFLSDEHDFAPYRSALFDRCKAIERALRKTGFRGHLQAARLDNHPDAGYAYYLFDTDRLSAAEAKEAVWRWLDRRYQGEAQA